MSQAPHVIRGLRGGLKLGQGALEDSLCEGAARHACAAASWRRPPRTAPPSTASRARSRTRYAHPQPAARRRRVEAGPVRRGGRAGRGQDAQGRRRSSTATITCGPTRRSRGWRSCRRRSRRTARVTAGNASGIVDGGAALILASRGGAKAHGLKPLGAARRLGDGRRRPEHHGHRPGAGDPQGCSSRAGLTLDDIDLFEINEAFAGAVPRRRKGARARSREGQRQRRRDRARPSARRDRHAAAADADARAAAPRREARRRRRLHRRRPGDRRARGDAVELGLRWKIRTVGVVGCGLMGSGIAQVCGGAGYQTIVREVNDGALQAGSGASEIPRRTASQREGTAEDAQTRRSPT